MKGQKTIQRQKRCPHRLLCAFWPSVQLTVALLVLFTGAARTRIIPTDLRCGLLRRQRRFLGSRRSNTERIIVIGMMVLNVVHFGLRRRGFLGVFGAHLHRHQNSRHFKANAVQQTLKQFKGFTLIFLLGIFLRIAAQMNPLAQVVKNLTDRKSVV